MSLVACSAKSALLSPSHGSVLQQVIVVLRQLRVKGCCSARVLLDDVLPGAAAPLLTGPISETQLGSIFPYHTNDLQFYLNLCRKALTLCQNRMTVHSGELS